MARFEGQKYMTKGFSTLPPKVQLEIFELIDRFVAESNRINRDIDYLQVVRLDSSTDGDKSYQKITHSQEQPEYTNEISFEFESPTTTKVFVISDDYPDDYPDGVVVTFLLSSEY